MRRRLLSLTPYVVVNYTVTFDSALLGYTSTADAYASLSSLLQSSVQSGNFTQYLRLFGSDLGCSYLGNASSSKIQIGPLVVVNSAVPTLTPVVSNANNNNGAQVSIGVAIGLAIATLVLLITIAVAIYYKLLKKDTALEDNWYSLRPTSLSVSLQSVRDSAIRGLDMGFIDCSKSSFNPNAAKFDSSTQSSQTSDANKCYNDMHNLRDSSIANQSPPFIASGSYATEDSSYPVAAKNVFDFSNPIRAGSGRSSMTNEATTQRWIATKVGHSETADTSELLPIQQNPIPRSRVVVSNFECSNSRELPPANSFTAAPPRMKPTSVAPLHDSTSRGDSRDNHDDNDVESARK
eukprot:gene33118-42834_t